MRKPRIRSFSAVTSASSFAETGASPSRLFVRVKPILDAMEAGETRILLALFEIIRDWIDGIVEIGEKIRHGFDLLIGSTRLLIGFTRLFEIARLDGIIQRLRRLHQRIRLRDEEHLELGQGPEISHECRLCCLRFGLLPTA